MKRILKSSILLASVFLFFFLLSCKKSEDPNDLFPLKLGNQFFFKYQSKKLSVPFFDETNGLETWVVEKILMQDQTITYIIKRRLNALRTVYGYQTDTFKTVITDSSFIQVKEDKISSIISSSFSTSDDIISLKRYQNETQVEIKKVMSNWSWTYLFKSDSGLVRRGYYHGPNQVSYSTLILYNLETK